MFTTVPNLGTDTLTIDASSLYRIAAPSTPAEVREVVLEKAATPEGISRAEVEALVATARAEAAAAAVAGKLVVTSEEFADSVNQVTEQYDAKIAGLTAERDSALETARVLSEADNNRHHSTKGAKPQAELAAVVGVKRTDLFRDETSSGVSRPALSKARSILRYSPDLADSVMLDEVKLDSAYDQATALERKRKGDAMRRLRQIAPDLAARVDAGGRRGRPQGRRHEFCCVPSTFVVAC